MRVYSIVAEAIAAGLFTGLGGWLAWAGRRARGRAFRLVSVGGVAICVFLAATSVHHLLILDAGGDALPSPLGDSLLGVWAAVRATASLLLAVCCIVLAVRYWSSLGRAQSMVDVLTDRVPPGASTRQAGLSGREREVLGLIRKGILADEDIARALHISPATAATHVQNILRKTRLHNRRDLMLLPPAAPRSPRRA